MGVTYRVKETNLDNPIKSILESTVTEAKHEFTMEEVITNRDAFIKQGTEQEAELKVSKAKMDNIERNHGFVKEMSEQDLFTAHLYQEETTKVKALEKSLKANAAGQKEYKKVIEDIEKQAKVKF